MNSISEKRLTMIAFRAIGILTILIGLMLTTHTIIQFIAVSSLASNWPRGLNINIKGTIGNMKGWAIVAQLSVSAWGFAVYKLANWLSGIIVKETETGITCPDS
ncbi:MAG: hypothetical protein GY845_38520 [Planctomycetes bacterium]|nr:hypothetical protein [Planctomycetota bacterium]